MTSLLGKVPEWTLLASEILLVPEQTAIRQLSPGVHDGGLWLTEATAP